MIDVVFLLLVFFMLAARFGQDTSLPLSTSGTNTEFDAPPRLLTVTGSLIALNGRELPLDTVLDQLNGQVGPPEAPVFLQPLGNTTLQQLVRVIDALRGAGLTSVVVVDTP